MDVIVTYDLTKKFGEKTALNGLNLLISEGSAVACIGERGSGKTTLIRLLSGLCRPTSGECSILGMSPYFEMEKLHSAVGTVLGTARLYEQMTLSENMLFFASLNRIDENDALERMSFLLHKLDIWEGRDQRLTDLPTGVVYRASIARALMHSPRILLMDFPASGLNRESSEAIREMISYLAAEEGTTVLLCTEDTAYAQAFCREYAILKNGSLLARGDLESLRQAMGVRYRAVLRLGEGDTPPKGFRRKDGLWKKWIDSEAEMPNIIFSAVGNGTSLYEARMETPTLEEIYRACLAGGKQRAGEEDEQDDIFSGESVESTDAELSDDRSRGGKPADEGESTFEVPERRQPETVGVQETGEHLVR